MAMNAVNKLMISAQLATMTLSEGEGAASTFDIAPIMQDAVDTVKTQSFTVLAIVVPAIVIITAAVIGIKFGIGWLRKIKGN